MKKIFVSLVSIFLISIAPITNRHRSDGFGSQFQGLIYCAIWAEFNDREFIYTPFTAMEHNYNNDSLFLEKKEELINFRNHFKVNTDPEFQWKNTISIAASYYFFEKNIRSCANSKTLTKIKKLFRENKQIDDYYDSSQFNVAVHVRRVNLHDSTAGGELVSDEIYLNIINALREEYRECNPCIHIFSQGDEEAFQKIYSGSDVVFHIDDSIEDSFASMVLADVLVTSVSALSYVAGILSEGIVYYIPYWHPPLPNWRVLDLPKYKPPKALSNR